MTAELARSRVVLAVMLVALGVLVVEIALTRLLSFTLWYHFTYVVLAVALLGYGASGAFLACSKRLQGLPPLTLVHGSALLATVAGTLALLAIRFLPFRPLEIATDPLQLPLMALYLLAIALPFFACGLAIAAALRHWREHTTAIYFADLAGAGLGCALAIPAIWIFGAPGAIAAGLASLAAAAVVAAPRPRRAVTGALAAACLLATAGVATFAEFRASPDKPFARYVSGGSPPLLSRWSPIFRVDVYETGFPTSRPGMSPLFRGQLPDARYIAHDGTAEAAIYRFGGRPEELAFLDWNIASAPYRILRDPEVLVIGLGGGFDILAGIHGGARRMVAVELDPITVDVLRDHSRDFSGALLERPEISTVVAEGRSFLRNQGNPYDLIQLTGVDTLAALSSGAYVLAESYLYTVEAMRDYLSRLSDDGVLSFLIGDFHWASRDARFSMRHVANFAAAARELGWSDPASRVAVIASPNPHGLMMLEMLFKRTPFSPDEVLSLREYAAARGFELWALPGVRTGSPLELLLTGNEALRERVLRTYPLDVRETRDDRPFFFHFYRWRDLLGVSARDIDLGHAGATGQLVLAALLLFALVASIAFILVPLLVSRRIALATRGSLRFAAYFALVGAGFMLLEISLIQRFVLFLGHPTYAIATTLAALLVFTGLGSFFSGRSDRPPRALLLPALVALAAVALAYAAWLPGIFQSLLGSAIPARVVVAVALLAPLGLALGVFFPSGLREVGRHHPDLVPWAWGVNGGASVIGSVLAMVLAITVGFSTVALGALALYAVAVASFLSVGPPR